ncbi:VOC family protein [Tahibacter amnicola]|uniref:VOC family protein n=1 Tax=Tahibacter amnicola TaxID=2976241 RepID=A0ABY6B9Y8_9GAMM|nr:VOC family protein [Tahibacter amnicola]UXI66876.1 VOC family protein [Tahibacter amnicola]
MGTTAPGYHTLTPYLIVRDAAAAIDFYTRAFGARELFRLADPASKVGHAELAIGDSRFMLADEFPDFGALGPGSIGGTPVCLHLYVADVDTFFAGAVASGATELRPVQDQFYGDRVGMLVDPYGHKWSIATQKEVVTPEEMQRRWSATAA